ncbi:MAG TPA: hypothetical protein VD902_00960 [Symbiobacteriaceae bacterium]|nr:hypothetical protein [Symbiobacteriaceae bacterium]
MIAWLDWGELVLDLVSVLLLVVLWRTYRRNEPVAPQMYLVTMLCAAVLLGIYIAAMPAGHWAADGRFAGPAALLGFLWGLASSRGMILFRSGGRFYLKGTAWVPAWATLNFAGGKLLEEFGPGLWGVGGLAVMLVATLATLAANLVLITTLLSVRRYYGSAPRKGGKLHFCHTCGAGYERAAHTCPACRTRKLQSA